MPSFWSYISNEKYSIGCTGQTVYVYNKNGEELAKFKDLPYAYTAAISPCDNIFVVKTAEGRMAIYSLSPACLIKKFRFSKIKASQDDNFCFSPDGKEFYNIERHIDTCKTALSIYDTTDFSLKRRILDTDFSLVLTAIESCADNNEIYLLGFKRNTDNIASEYFVGKLKDDTLKDIIYISQHEHVFYQSYVHLRMTGFSEKTYTWSHFDVALDKLKSFGHSLSKLWNHYNKQ